MKKSIMLMMVVSFFVAVLISGSVFAAGNTATVANTGDIPIFLVVKNQDGTIQMPTVAPGESYEVPEGLAKVGVYATKWGPNNGFKATVTRRDGGKETVTGKGHTVFVNPQTNFPVIRDRNSYIILPTVDTKILSDSDGKAFVGGDFGYGLGPMASDNPVEYVGHPLGSTKELDEKIMDELDDAHTVDEIDAIADKYDLSDKDLDELLYETDPEKWDWYYSGSGYTFGDCARVGCMIGPVLIGRGFNGANLGRELHHFPGITEISRDGVLLNSLKNDSFSVFLDTLRNSTGVSNIAEDADNRSF